MKINSIKTKQTFCKTPVMKCKIKKTQSNEESESTLYKMDCLNKSDLDEVKYSKIARYIYYPMLNDSENDFHYREYYILKDDNTNEVISCAQTSRHYRADNVEYPGYTTLIEEMKNNLKYVNPEEPVFAYLANHAINQYDSSLSIGFYPHNTKSLKHNNFSETKNGDWIIPEQRFLNLIDNASKRNQIEFII